MWCAASRISKQPWHFGDLERAVEVIGTHAGEDLQKLKSLRYRDLYQEGDNGSPVEKWPKEMLLELARRIL